MRPLMPTLVVLLLLAAGAMAADLHENIAVLNQQMMQLYGQGRFQEAVPLAAEIVSRFETAFGPDDVEVASSLNNLAELYVRLHRYPEAEPLYRRSLAIRQHVLGNDHPDTLKSAARLAKLLQLEKQDADSAPAAAIDHGVKARPAPTAALPPAARAATNANRDIERANQLSEQAARLNKQGRYGEAIIPLAQVPALLERALGPDHPALAVVRGNLAQLLVHEGHDDQAEPLFKQSLTQLEKIHAADDPEVAQAMVALAECYARQGRYTESELLFKRALPILEKAFGANHAEVKRALAGLTDVYRGEGRVGINDAFIKDRLALHKVGGTEPAAIAPDSGHPEQIRQLEEQLFQLNASGQFTLALPVALRLQSIVEQSYGADSLAAAVGLDSLVVLYRKLGRAKEAEALALKSQVIRDEARAADSAAPAVRSPP